MRLTAASFKYRFRSIGVRRTRLKTDAFAGDVNVALGSVPLSHRPLLPEQQFSHLNPHTHHERWPTALSLPPLHRQREHIQLAGNP